jgi:hypothetical protein
MERRLRAPSPALVISLIALFVALGGTTYAATNLPENSVGTEQLRKSAVTSVKIKRGAVTAPKINTKGLTVPTALHARSAASATNATNLGGQPANAFVGQCGLGSVALGASWYAPQLPTDGTYVPPNRYGGEGGFTCNGGTPEATKLATGEFFVEAVPALPSSHAYVLFANPDSRSATPLYTQVTNEVGGGWEVHTYNSSGTPTDPYYLEVMVTEQS